MDLRFPLDDDLLTFIILYNSRIAGAMKQRCKTYPTEYRIISLLDADSDTPRKSQLANILGVSPAAITIATKRLEDNRFLEVDEVNRTLRLTRLGLKRKKDTDEVIVEASQEFLSPLGNNLREMIAIGSTVTSSLYQTARIQSGHFFREGAMFEAFLLTEQRITNASHLLGLALSEFRLMFYLRDKLEGQHAGTIASDLLIPSSRVTAICINLLQKGALIQEADPFDKRRSILKLTSVGKDQLENAAKEIDLALMDVRQSNKDERNMYIKMARIIVGSLRKQRAKR